MSYRNFEQPDFATQSHSASQWIEWLDKNGALVPTAPRPPASCAVCQGAVGERDVGGYFERCFQCNGYDGYLDAFVPITYSLASGLESMLHRYKDFGDDYAWMATPLGSLLFMFLRNHRACLDGDAGGIDSATLVPSNNRARNFSQLDRLFDVVKGSPVREFFDWDPSVIQRDFSKTRPGRAQVKPSAYEVDAEAVDGRAVLLLDDTWTSGASLVSCAAALKEAGASYVVGLTLGRQLNDAGNYGSTGEIVRSARGRGWDDDDCVLCT